MCTALSAVPSTEKGLPSGSCCYVSTYLHNRYLESVEFITHHFITKDSRTPWLKIVRIYLWSPVSVGQELGNSPAGWLSQVPRKVAFRTWWDCPHLKAGRGLEGPASKVATKITVQALLA